MGFDVKKLNFIALTLWAEHKIVDNESWGFFADEDVDIIKLHRLQVLHGSSCGVW